MKLSLLIQNIRYSTQDPPMICHISSSCHDSQNLKVNIKKKNIDYLLRPLSINRIRPLKMTQIEVSKHAVEQSTCVYLSFFNRSKVTFSTKGTFPMVGGPFVRDFVITFVHTKNLPMYLYTQYIDVGT